MKWWLLAGLIMTLIPGLNFFGVIISLAVATMWFCDLVRED